MSNTINDLQAAIKNHGGLALQNRYQVIFTPPKMSLINLNPSTILNAVVSGSSLSLKNFINDPRDISIFCDSVNIPGRQISTGDHQTYAESRKYITGYIDEDVTMEFMLTQDFFMRNMMDDWLKSMFNSDSYAVSYKTEYVTDITIQQVDKEGNLPLYGVKLLNAYPTSIGGMTLGNANESTPQKMSITFSYDKFEVLGPLGGFASAAKSVADRLINII